MKSKVQVCCLIQFIRFLLLKVGNSEAKVKQTEEKERKRGRERGEREIKRKEGEEKERGREKEERGRERKRREGDRVGI